MTETPRAHIAMFSIAAHGHVNPSLDVIRELVDRGHRVSYAIPASFADKVAATGAEPVIWTSTLPTDEDPDAWGTELIDNIEPFLADAVQALPQLADAFAATSPTSSCTTSPPIPPASSPTAGASPPSPSGPTWSRGRGTRRRWPNR